MLLVATSKFRQPQSNVRVARKGIRNRPQMLCSYDGAGALLVRILLGFIGLPANSPTVTVKGCSAF
jgi:hypothetical protein